MLDYFISRSGSSGDCVAFIEIAPPLISHVWQLLAVDQ